jgi:hypothetical protein
MDHFKALLEFLGDKVSVIFYLRLIDLSDQTEKPGSLVTAEVNIN